MAALDTNVFDKVKTFADYNQLEQEFQLKKALAQQSVQTGGIDAASKANIFAAQLLSGAVAGGQGSYDQAKQKLASMGIDTAGYASDAATAAQQLQAARLAQSPLGSLMNFAQKDQSNAIALAGLTGEIPPNAVAPRIPSINPMLPALIKTESGENPNAVSPKGAGGLTQIMPATAADPGFGVAPLQGWDGKNPATAPVNEQLRFGSDYLNAMQERNGGDPRLAAASYNAGPGRVDAALAQLPKETQNYVGKVALPPKQPNETQAAYNQRLQNDPNVQANIELAKKTASKTADVSVDRQAGYTKAQGALQGFEQKANLVNSTIDKALATIDKPGSMATNYGQAFAKLPNTDARALNNYLDTIKGNVGFDQLQNMRDNSPTGGALGQVSDMENRLLQAVNGALDPMQGGQLKENLASIKMLYPQVLAEKKRAFAQDYGGFRPIGGNMQPPPPTPPPAGAKLYGTAGGKNVYKLTDGSFVMEQ